MLEREMARRRVRPAIGSEAEIEDGFVELVRYVLWLGLGVATKFVEG